jgi:hypothetical protein
VEADGGSAALTLAQLECLLVNARYMLRLNASLAPSDQEHAGCPQSVLFFDLSNRRGDLGESSFVQAARTLFGENDAAATLVLCENVRAQAAGEANCAAGVRTFISEHA